MKNLVMVVSAALVGFSSLAFGEDFYKVTCHAALKDKYHSQVDEVFSKTRSGPEFDYARDLAEENVLEVCATYMILNGMTDSHRCELQQCEAMD